MSDDNAAEDSSAIPGLSNLRQWRLNMEGGPKEAPPPVDDRLDIVSADQSLADSSIGERLLRLRQWRQQIVDDVAPEPTVYDPEAAAAALAADTDGPIQGRVKGQRLHQNTHDDAEMPEELTDTANVSARPKTPDATGIQRLAMLAHSARQVLRLQREDALVIKDEADRRRLVPETVIVLGVSLGASAVWSVLRLLDLLTRPAPLGSQTVYINNSVTPDRSWLDFSNQMATIVLTLVPVVLALYLLATVRRPADGPLHVMGLSRTTVPKDIVLGMAMAAGVGIPGLGLYA
ncbi:MAG: hypothetical protein FWD80_05440, partial [Propionibacteriaceae bacterium]|nr:hypothetical protein [Propionibacteriaceae bacterium]